MPGKQRPHRTPFRVTDLQSIFVPASATSAALRTARVLSWLVGVLMLASSAAGLWVDGLYQDSAVAAASLRGADLVTLVVPLVLAWAIRAGRRDSGVALLVWAGLLAFSTYNYGYYVFEVAFNDVFLLHVALFATSLFGLVFVLSGMDVPQVAARFGPRTPVRSVAWLLLLLALALVAMWGFYSARFAINGEFPADVLPLPLERIHLAYVMDMAVLAPAAAVGGVLLWRRRPWGYVIATAVCVATFTYQLTYISATAFMADAGVPDVAAFDPMELPIVLAFLVAAAAMLFSADRKSAAV